MPTKVDTKSAVFYVAGLVVLLAFIAFKTSSLMAAFLCGFLFAVIVEEALKNNK